MLINPISYPGNKNRLISQIKPELIAGKLKFVDVFAGGGTVAVNSGYSNLELVDSCDKALILFNYLYETPGKDVVSKTEDIISKYHLTYSRKKSKGYYKEYKHEGLSCYNRAPFEKLKLDYNEDFDVSKLFVLCIYGFNHYFRFNKKGEYNVPVGKVDFSESIYNNTINFCDGIKKFNIKFINCDFREEYLYKDDALYYFDPPYLITSAPYSSSWKEKDDLDLMALLDELDSSGKKFALSNVLSSNGKSNDNLISWSKSYNTLHIKRQYRNANYQKHNIGDADEVLIKNY